MVEAEASGELASVVVASASVRDACVTDAETTGIVASSALENPLSVPMEMCCAVDVSRTVATLFAAAVAAAMARTNNLAVCIAVGCFFGIEKPNLGDRCIQDCGEFYSVLVIAVGMRKTAPG